MKRARGIPGWIPSAKRGAPLPALAMALLAPLVQGNLAEAHGMRTAYLELVELSPGNAMVRWRLPVRAPGVTPLLPEGCRMVESLQAENADPQAKITDPQAENTGPHAENADPQAERIASNRAIADRVAATIGNGPGEAAFGLRCDGPLAGRKVEIAGLGPLVSEAVVWASLSDTSSEPTDERTSGHTSEHTNDRSGKTTASHLLTPAAPAWELPRTVTKLGISRDYISLGIRHILSGADHLLFLLLLVLTLKRARAIIAAETAFTVSHSISFSATALGWVVVSSRAAEACIALSLVLVALDVERRHAPPVSTRNGAAMALVFGLVHGLGFAGGLREIGLPEKDAAWALAGFGAGVELGQVLFLAAVLALYWLVSRTRWRPQVALTLAYGAGGLASFWLIERLLTCLRFPG